MCVHSGLPLTSSSTSPQFCWDWRLVLIKQWWIMGVESPRSAALKTFVDRANKKKRTKVQSSRDISCVKCRRMMSFFFSSHGSEDAPLFLWSLCRPADSSLTDGTLIQSSSISDWAEGSSSNSELLRTTQMSLSRPLMEDLYKTSMCSIHRLRRLLVCA